MNNGKRDPLDEALAGLPHEVEPERDLWPGIEAEIRSGEVRALDSSAPSPSLNDHRSGVEYSLRESTQQTGPGASPASTRWGRGWTRGGSWKLAASVLLVIGASITAYVLTRQSSPQPAPQIAQPNAPTPTVTVQPASFGSELLGTQYTVARAELDRMFEERLVTLAPETRDKLRASLDDMRRATQEISAVLAEHPSDPLLQQLLLSAYQNELKLLADVTDMTTPSPRVEL